MTSYFVSAAALVDGSTGCCGAAFNLDGIDHNDPNYAYGEELGLHFRGGDKFEAILTMQLIALQKVCGVVLPGDEVLVEVYGDPATVRRMASFSPASRALLAQVDQEIGFIKTLGGTIYIGSCDEESISMLDTLALAEEAIETPQMGREALRTHLLA